MSKRIYNKPAITFEQQLKRLKARGLHINDEKNALYILSNLSYYRFSGYLYPFLKNPKTDHLFKVNSTFESAFNLYRFDRDLRTIVFYELEKIEIAIRTQMIYVLSHKYGPFWFELDSLFHKKRGYLKYNTTFSKLVKQCNDSDEVFIISYKNKYQNPNPPSWMALEVVSFGTISSLYKLLLNSKEKIEIAHHFGLSDKVFESWMHTLVYIRNIIAHHSRLWNKEFRINPAIPRTPKLTWLNCDVISKEKNLDSTKSNQIKNDRVFYLLSIIVYLLQTINPNSKFKTKVKTLISEYHNIDIIKAMGFHKNWHKENLWS